jgi:putative endonuclease|tara:strand:+ start:145 stop:477 length:333 start_codon:yes stop_codon:yes gene_type:complete
MLAFWPNAYKASRYLGILPAIAFPPNSDLSFLFFLPLASLSFPIVNRQSLIVNPHSPLTQYQKGVKSTKPKRPWNLLYKESFRTRTDARKREKYLKSAAGRRFRKEIMGD